MKFKRVTPEDIAKYGVVNAPDKLVGNPHDNKMIFDRLIREVVAGAINALIDQWEEMDEAEDQRDEAEEQREAAEQARQEAENLRQNTFQEEIEEAKRHEEGAYRAMNLAAENAHWSEAFAVGQENGVDIDSTNPAYRNNAKFYAEQARNVVGGDDVFVCPNILVSAADWSASTRYDDFPWEATAQVKDINGQHVPFVVFDHVDAATYGLATVADTADESLTIYSVTMPERDILIPVTVFMSEGAIQSAWKALSGGKEGEVLAKQSGKDHDFKWMPISGLGAGLDGERGLAIYRANKPWSEWTSEYFDFDDFILPAEYKPKPNDLVLTSNNYLCWIYSVNENAREVVVASFMPAVSLNGGPGPAGDPGVSPNISILPGEQDEEDGTVRYGTVIEVTNPDGSKVYAFVPDGRDGNPGPAGASGKDGSAGKDGVTFTPSVSSAGVLSWTNDGGKQNPSSVNIKGPAGSAGKDGARGKDGERGLAIYRANKPWSDWSSEYFDFSDFQLPNGYVPKVNDLVLTSNNYLCWIYEVNAVTDTFLVASFSPPANLNGGTGPAGSAGKDGVTFTPSVSSAGVLSWTNDGGKQNPSSVNIKGPAGSAGKDGARGKDGERGLAIYRANKPWSDWSSEYFDFSDFQLPNGYVPKVNDLVLTSNNYLCWIYEVNAVTDTFLVASFSPPANLNGGTGPAGSAGKDGVTFTPSVSSAGVLSWTNDGGKQNPSSVNIKGPAGSAGKDGARGKDGERGLAIYRANKPWSDWSSEYFDFSDFQLPNGYVPKVNDLVLTSNNYLCWIYEVNAVTDTFLVASFSPPANLNGGTGPAGSAGKDGVTFTPSVSSAGVLSWTNDGGKQNPTSVNIKGPAGPAGEPGDTPYIGANGNWWIGGTDTGVAATGSGSGGASVQADWGENDETKLSHVKGRTHWKEEIGSDDVIVPETTKTFDGYYLTLGGSKLGIVEGITYIVQFNGEEYTVVGQNYKGDMIMGNARLIDADGEDTEEPFVITWIGGTNYYLTRRKSNPRTLTVSVNSKKVVIWHKLDSGYLPDGMPYTEKGVVELLNAPGTFDPNFGAFFLSNTPLDVVAGETLFVNYNGTEYTCEVMVGLSFQGMDLAWACGNAPALLGTGNTGEPFVIAEFGTAVGLIPLDGATAVSVVISRVAEIVHPMDPKFLPDYLPKKTIDAVTAVPVQSLSFADLGGVYGANLPPIDISGVEYVEVRFDGKTYRCEVKEIPSGGGLYAGNASFQGIEDTGEPFCLVLLKEQSTIVVYDTNSEHEVGVMWEETTTTELPLMYQERENVVFEFRDKNAGTELSHGVFPELEDIYQDILKAVFSGREVSLYEVTGSDTAPKRNRYYLEKREDSPGTGNVAVFASFRTGFSNNFGLEIRRIELNDLNGVYEAISRFAAATN